MTTCFRASAMLFLATSLLMGWEQPTLHAPAPPPNPPHAHQRPRPQKANFPPAEKKPLSQEEMAWQMLEGACKGDNTSKRVAAVHALGLMRNDARARVLAEHALSDNRPAVRIAAAVALAELHTSSAIPALKTALGDKDPSVVLAAAHALELMHNEAGYQVYYQVLTGQRKAGSNIIASEFAQLTNPRDLAKLGFTQGLGFVPFAGIGWSAYKELKKGDPTPIRAAAARALANDPDPSTTEVLEQAAGDDHWLVRAAALEALARRGDPSAEGKISAHLSDENDSVRYTAASAFLELRAIQNMPHSPATEPESSSSAGGG